ncbi:MAG: amino acid adenylation domain-containing protein, partial [Methylococcales bacterium]|nr:amino acid adenylation domain-containing protein [Methylococcales bacterium]
MTDDNDSNNHSLKNRKQLLDQLMQQGSEEEWDAFDLSYAQERLWFIDQFSPQDSTYNMVAAVHLQGKLRVELLERAINKIIERHESLRTNFSTIDDEPVQEINPYQTLRIEISFLNTIKKENRWQAMLKKVNEEIQHGFDLENDSLFRLKLFCLNRKSHVLIINMHHIISDGWSINVFVKELALCYTAYINEQEPVLEELSVQYIDYADWEKEWLSGERLQQQLNYWKQQLAGIEVLELHTDLPRPPVQTTHGSQLHFQLDHFLTAELKQLAIDKGVTLYMVLLAIFQVLLYRYTAQKDFTIGTPIANRSRIEFENLIGFFVNTLVIRTDLDDQLSFNDLLKQVKATTVDAFAHQSVPFAKLVETLHPDRNMSYSPLCQVMFALQTSATKLPELPDLHLEKIQLDYGTAKFDLTLEFEEDGQQLKGLFEYNTDLFEIQSIERMVNHFTNLVRNILASPATLISKLVLFSKEEKQQLLTDCQAKKQVYDSHLTLNKGFETQAKQYPNIIAVINDDESLSYQQLNQRANQLSFHLNYLGITPGDCVAMCLQPGLYSSVAILAILKTGAIYVPLDNNYPIERLKYMLEDSQAKVVITESKLFNKLKPKGLFETEQVTHAVFLLDEDWDQCFDYSQTDPVSNHVSSDTAYIIYTSGSTGKPKGVCGHHRGVLNLLDDFNQRKPLFANAKCSLWTSLSFDVSLYEIFSAWLSAGTLIITPDKVRLDSQQLFTWLGHQHIDSAYLPPFVLSDMADNIEQAPSYISLKRLLVGVEPIAEKLLLRIQNNVTELQIINGYGPTEATICSTLYNVSNGNNLHSNTPIGKAVQNLSHYVLDKNLNMVPTGVPGELYIGGTGLTNGYLNNAEQTQNAFINNPFDETNHSVLYKTGDRVLALTDGQLMFIGRNDHQVKLRGYRIELGEIESALLNSSEVRECVVIVRQDSPGNQLLVAYIIPEPSAVINQRDLRQAIAEKLPDYMIPNAMMVLESLPQTANGKINRKALPKPTGRGYSAETEYTAPRSPFEESLVDIWQELLNLKQIGIYDNFFELGGHSLLATRVMSQVTSLFNTELALKILFEKPTIAGLAQHIQQALEGEFIHPPLESLIKSSHTSAAPLSHAQERLWFLDQMNPGNSTYNIPAAMAIKGQVDEDAIFKSIHAIIEKHEILRTVFLEKYGRPYQYVKDSLRIDIPLIDLRHLNRSGGEREIKTILDRYARFNFNLSTGPLIKVCL